MDRIASRIPRTNNLHSTMATAKKNTTKTAVKAAATKPVKIVRAPVVKLATKPVSRAKPGEQHPGQTAEQGKHHDRKGSQLERERNLHPNSTIPHAGPARSNKRPKGKGGVPRSKATK